MEHAGPGRLSAARILGTLRWVAFAACVALFAHTLARSNLSLAWERIRAIGPLAVVVMLPFPVAIAMDAWAWRVLLAGLDRKVPFLTLFKVRLASEALTNSVPVGALVADAIQPILVARRSEVPFEDVFAASTAKRWTVVRMHGTYVAIACAFGRDVLDRASPALLGSGWLLNVCFACAATLVLVSVGIEALAARGQVAGRVSAVLGNARFARAKEWIEIRRHRFAHADVQLARLSKNTAVGLSAAWRMLSLWCLEGLETYVIFRLLGAPLGFVEVMALDAALSVVRSSAMFAPGGIGVQDVGYLAMLEAMGVPGAASLGPAFLVIKRAKETIWIAIGFAVLARLGPREDLQKAKEEVARSSIPPASVPPPPHI
ncbi:lysylphosphatidylglycerol synthase transmembrane domain-containing protein [soil metagenome]